MSDWCKLMPFKFGMGTSNRFSQIITGDETWTYSYKFEKKAQSQEWVFLGENVPIKVVLRHLTGKQIVAIFVDKRYYVASRLLKNPSTINAEL